MNKPSNNVRNWTNKTKKRTLKQFFSGNNAPLPSKGLTYRTQNGKIIPKPSFLTKTKTQKGGVPEYLLRAASMLSERSHNTRKTNLNRLKNKTNRNNLRKMLNNTRKNRNNRK